MPNVLVPVAAEGVPTTRRSFLSAIPGLAAASAIPAVLISSRPADAASDHPAVTASIQENSALLEAYDKLLSARAEAAAAQAALEWLADEWKHLWPLAPEELLGGANAQHSCGNDSGERDIIGRYLIRDTSMLTTRTSGGRWKENPQTCFSVLSSSDAREALDGWKQHAPKGRTEKSLAINRAFREKTIKSFEHKLALAEKYEAETARLHKAAGVEDAKKRIVDTRNKVWNAEREVSTVPAFTLEGLRIKAEAIRASEIFETLFAHDSPLGDMARFCQSVLEVAERTSA